MAPGGNGAASARQGAGMIAAEPVDWKELYLGVVQNRPFLGYTGERKPPAFEARFRSRRWPVREAVSLPRSSVLQLNGSQAQQRQPVRMALAGHQFPRAFAGALGNPAAHEAAMVQEELQ
jgi:hypothetical protein